MFRQPVKLQVTRQDKNLIYSLAPHRASFYTRVKSRGGVAVSLKVKLDIRVLKEDPFYHKFFTVRQLRRSLTFHQKSRSPEVQYLPVILIRRGDFILADSVKARRRKPPRSQLLVGDTTCSGVGFYLQGWDSTYRGGILPTRVGIPPTGVGIPPTVAWGATYRGGEYHLGFVACHLERTLPHEPGSCPKQLANLTRSRQDSPPS
ncbi:hypothetical protein EGW08_003363 [Elysia chlorotica]|uniref:Uncharacterized protein n=1 Tax=Elysia chlorotica TaxID=188477 RepID=A0A3S1CCG8_ELYCH|nr:hypothetical protein EGW08_003363 [Elysia chlorotica]